jgi:hypothetical protein
VAKRARKVISKECEESIDRLLSAVDALPEEFTTLRPDIVRGLLNNAGTKQWSISSILSSMYTNSLLASTGMFGANIASAMNQGVIHAPKSMIRNGVTNSVAAFMATMGRDAQLFSNMARYFASAMKTGIASDIASDITLVARSRGITKEELIEEAKKAYLASWAATDSNFKDIDAEEFAKGINLTDEEVVRFFTDIEYMSNQKVPSWMSGITIPQRAAVAIDEAAKVFFRTIRISELAREQAVKDASKPGNEIDVGELHTRYFKEVMDVHNSRYQGEYKLAAEQTKAAKFRAVRQANLALEKKSNDFFSPLFSKEDIPYEDIREFALNMTFQRRLPLKEGANANLAGLIALINREKSKTGSEYGFGDNLKSFALNSLFPFAKTPYNIVVDGMSYTPLAFIPMMRPKVLKKKIIAGKTQYQVKDMDDWFVRAAIGTTAIAPIAMLYSLSNEDGLPYITGTAKDAQERRRMQQAGIPERSVLIDDVYVGYDRIEPTGTVLGWYTDMADAIHKLANYDPKDPEYNRLTEFIDDTMVAILNATANKTILESTINFVDYFRYDKVGGLEQYGTDIAKGFVPTGVSDLARIIDGQERLARTPVEQVQQRIPFLRERLPLDTSRVSGASVKEAGPLEIITKIRVTPINQTEAQRYIHRTQANIPVIDSSFIGIKLSSAETALLREITQPYVDRVLGALVASQKFQNADAFRQKEMLEYGANYASHPGTNEALMTEFMFLGNKQFGATWVQSLANRKWNQRVRDQGLNLMVEFKDVEEF